MRSAKADLRRDLLARRDALPAPARAAASEAVARGALALPEVAGARVVACYVPIGSEVDTRRLLAELLASRKRVAVPRTDVAAHALVMHEVTSLDALAPGHFRVPEPDPRVHPDRSPSEVDVVIVPGLAFDPRGHRLGYGRGYFDRWLSGFGGTSVGVVFEALLLDAVPTEAHDVAVDVVVTESRTLRPER